MRSVIPKLIIALKHLIKANQVNFMFKTFLCAYYQLDMSKNIPYILCNKPLFSPQALTPIAYRAMKLIYGFF